MDDTAATPFPSQDELARLLPGYRLDPEPVSQTAMSRIHFATDTKLRYRRVAVKIMAEQFAARAEFRRRFLQEIRLMSGLEHPNIIDVLDAAGDDDDLLYLVMRRADGDLRGVLRHGPLDLRTTVHIVKQVAAALDYAHDRGIVHRDVKPGNILIHGDQRHVYLCDFGIAKDRLGDQHTRPGELIGTVGWTAPEQYGYMAPEVFLSAGQDTPTPHDDTVPIAELRPATRRERAGDVYSLGAVLHYCLTGQRPFGSAWDQQHGNQRRVSELRPGLPKALDDVVLRATHLNPDQRYGTCAELAEALTRAAETGHSRNRLYLVASVLVAALVGGVLLYSTPLGDGATDASAGSLVPPGDSGPGPSESGTSTVSPVTGDEVVHRFPEEGECVTDHPDRWYVVSCDSELAAEQVLKIEMNPEDPNPAQPDHDDAAWQVCSSVGPIGWDWYWKDSAGDDEEWDPEVDTIYWIVCVKEL